MTDKEKVEFKKKLDAEIKDLCSRLPTLEEAAKPVAPDNAVGRLSRMDAIAEQGIREAALREAQAKLKKLKSRLSAVDEQGFDLCAGCRKPIAIARLMFLPETNRCVNCSG